jgi:acyl-CoA thioesterase
MSDQSEESQGARDQRARRVADFLFAREGTGPAWGIAIEEAREGYARVAMRVRADMLNGHKTAHGGMIFALADTAFAYACNSRDETTVAQSANIIFLSPARAGELLTAEASERGLSGRSGACAVTVRGDDGRVIAEFQGASRTIGGSILSPKK